jgi:hypothetical protein
MQIRELTRLSTRRSGPAENIGVVRRNMAPSRDWLTEFYYRVNPEARAIRDYLEFHRKDIERRVAEMQESD